MKNIKPIKLDKYKNETEFNKINDYVYKSLIDGSYRTALTCELEEDENLQYPLEDILDKYYVNCTDYIELKTTDTLKILSFELEGSLGDDEEDFKNITEVLELVGKRVYNKLENGYIMLIIE